MGHVTQLQMRLPTLEGLPEPELPHGYTLRTWRDGDEAAWAELMNGAIGSWDAESARTRFLAQEGVARDRIYFVLHHHEPVATATARRRPTGPPETGYLHMLAVAPAERGAGLGRAVSLAALRHLRREGCRDAILHTDDDRLPAIRTYLGLGFVPDPTAADHAGRWRRVLEALDG